MIKYPFQKLAEGNYTLKLKIWDTYNNSSESTLKVRVGLRQEVVKSLIVFPNPFSENINFQLSPSEEGDDLEIDLNITDLSGKLIDSFSTILYNTDPNSTFFNWKGSNKNQDTMTTGMYLYQVSIKSMTQQKSQILTGKLLFKR